MKLVTLNTWGGIVKEPLLDFLREHKDEVDIFCFQEVINCENKEQHEEGKTSGSCHNLHSLFEKILDSHTGYFRPYYKDWYGLAIFARKGINVLDEGEKFVFKEKGYIPDGDVGNHARNIQYVILDTPHGVRTIINFHGLWNGKGKTDTEDRLLQSGKILDFTKELKHPLVLCGDFNLLPSAKSLTMFEEAGLKDLIKEHKVTSTRTSFYTKPDKYADYVFTSPEIKVSKFSVLPHEVSDHAALFVDFE